MASTLPPNILSYIGTFVEKEDRPHCALVCKHWTEPFLDAYWGKLEIGNEGIDFNTLDSNKSLLINAHRVWAGIFRLFTSKNHLRLLEFQQYFPGIRYLKFDDRMLSILYFSDVVDWGFWQSLTHISITFDNTSEPVFLDYLFLKLSLVPCLVRLELYDPEHPPISWNDFEFLHKYLPRLEYLKHDFPFKPITRDEIESIRAVDPAQTMTRLEFDANVNPLWLFYFELKYPNLRHFILDNFASKRPSLERSLNRHRFPLSRRNRIDYNPQDYQSDLRLLSTLDQFFPYLKKADTVLRNKNMYLPFIFFETLGHFGTKIEHVKLRYERLFVNEDANRCLQPISESLKFLEIDFRDKCGTIPFVVCPRLVTLYIDGHKDTIIKVDAILECFPALRSLYIKDAMFYLSTNPYSYTPHPLQRLKIKDSYISKDALHYLSIRCSQLKHVTFIDIGHNGINQSYYDDGDYDEPGQLIFDMSMSNLDTFVFIFTDILLRGLNVFPKHYMIQQMENDNDILQATWQSPRINWYHICCDRTNRQEKLLEWELGRRDIEFGQRYLKDFDRRQKCEKERKDIKKYPYGYVQKRFWKKDLEYGVFVFRFKSVKNHFFRIK